MLFFFGLRDSEASPGPTAPLRIISLAPSLTDLVIALGGSGNLVGVTSHARLPAGLGSIFIVGDLYRWKFETIIALEPDLILIMASGEGKHRVEHLTKLGLRVETFRIESMEDLRQSTRRVGDLLGRSDDATQLIGKLTTADPSFGESPNRTAVFLTSTFPFFASSSDSFEGDLLRQSGWKNALPPGPIRRPKLSPENLIALDPDVIFVAQHGDHPIDLPEAVLSLRAVRNDRVVSLPSDLMLRPGARSADAIDLLRRHYRKMEKK